MHGRDTHAHARFQTPDAGSYPLLDVECKWLAVRSVADAVLVFLRRRPCSTRTQLRGHRPRRGNDQRRLQPPDEIRKLSEYDYVVVNSAIENTQTQLGAILAGERLRRIRLTDDAGGMSVAEEYLREWADRLAP